MGRTTAPPLNGELVLAARERKRLSQIEVCVMAAEHGCDLSPSTLSRIENGRVKWPAKRALDALAAVLELSKDDMFLDEPIAA